MDIKTPEQLLAILKSIKLDDKAKFELNRTLANYTRTAFRKQIRAQRDINDKSYAPRKRQATRTHKKTGKVATLKNMLMGMASNLKTEVSSDGFGVGLVGLEGHIAEVHNKGKSVVYMCRINGFFNKKTQRWEGGEKRKASYKMPQRQMIGWNKPLERQIAQIILKEMQFK